ncbi:MAG: hypothetical protein U0V72_13770 [Cytophagales bacterium]
MKFLTKLFIITVLPTLAQNIKMSGMYFQWGYNEEWYTKSNLHFRMSNGNNFVVHNVKAHQRTNFSSIFTSPKDITVPQYNVRIGLYLNEQRTAGIEINYDHTKYVVSDYQTAHVTGQIDGKAVDSMVVMDPKTFLHFEHTDGANFVHLNYFKQYVLKKSKVTQRPLFTYIWKAGAGVNVPKTDFTWRGDRYNNQFHIAGYNISAETGARAYVFKKLFFEGTVKSGYVRYMNALVNTETSKGNRASHGFGYFEVIATLGYQIHFNKDKNKESTQQ